MSRPARTLFMLMAMSAGGLTTAALGQEPRLLIAPADAPALKIKCGLAPDVEVRGSGNRFARYAGDFGALQAHFSNPLGGIALPGELMAAAFLELVDPTGPQADLRRQWLADQLAEPDWLVSDPLELVIAFDWAYDALPSTSREKFLTALETQVLELEAEDSPLAPREFRLALAGLALAQALDQRDQARGRWLAVRQRVIADAERYVADVLPNFIAYRGAAPRTPAGAADEELLTALLVEFADPIVDASLWDQHGPALGRWLEHYLLQPVPLQGTLSQLPRDAGNGGQDLPAGDYTALYPITAHLVATRTGYPAARRVANRVTAALRAAKPETAARAWRFIPIVFDLAEMDEPLAPGLPLGTRNLGNAIVSRQDDATMTCVWLETPELYLDARESIDAGHFLLYHGGLLTGRGIDDVAALATSAHNGGQYLGRRQLSFDIDQYRIAPLAHNCMVFADPVLQPEWRGRDYLVAGGHRLFPQTNTNYQTPKIAHPNRLAELRAYATQPGASYVALDLRTMYHPRLLKSYTREFFLLLDRLLVVVDRYETVNLRTVPAAIFQLPVQPEAGQQPLAITAQTSGYSPNAGIWRYTPASWISWQVGTGRAFFRHLDPDDSELYVVGGPGEHRVIGEDPAARQTYVGGDPQGFERLIELATAQREQNAWYRLGRVPDAGPALGLPHWGRIEVHPRKHTRPVRLISLIAFGNAGTMLKPPSVVTLRDPDETVRLVVSLGERTALLALPGGDRLGGTVTLELSDDRLEWSVPIRVQPTLPFEKATQPTLITTDNGGESGESGNAPRPPAGE